MEGASPGDASIGVWTWVRAGTSLMVGVFNRSLWADVQQMQITALGGPSLMAGKWTGRR
jgi:hypothetical protein